MSDFEAFDLGRQSKAQPMNVPFTNSGHGHAWTRPDGVKARCGGVLLCTQCLFDSAEMRKAQTATSPQWQPIETAPKNTECEFLGPVIIATAGHAPSFVRWSSTLGDWEAAHGQRDPITGLHQFPRVKTQPTHWMPLPSAPIAKDSASNQAGEQSVVPGVETKDKSLEALQSPQFAGQGAREALETPTVRSKRFNDTTGALTWNYKSAELHPDRCVCQNETTPHVHRAEPPHSCARCSQCDAYRPAVVATKPKEPGPASSCSRPPSPLLKAPTLKARP